MEPAEVLDEQEEAYGHEEEDGQANAYGFVGVRLRSEIYDSQHVGHPGHDGAHEHQLGMIGQGAAAARFADEEIGYKGEYRHQGGQTGQKPPAALFQEHDSGRYRPAGREVNDDVQHEKIISTVDLDGHGHWG